MKRALLERIVAYTNIKAKQVLLRNCYLELGTVAHACHSSPQGTAGEDSTTSPRTAGLPSRFQVKVPCLGRSKDHLIIVVWLSEIGVSVFL